eukprot:46962_1
MSDRQKISFLEDYVLSSDRLSTTAKAFNEDTEEYWQYSLLYILNKSDGGKDAQTQAFLKKLEKSQFKNSDIIKNLLFRQKLKAFDSSSRAALIKEIKQIVGISDRDLQPGAKANAEDEKGEAPAKGSTENIKLKVGTKRSKKGGVEVDVSAAITLFLKQAQEQYLNLADLFTPSAVDAIANSKDAVAKLSKGEVSGLLELLSESAPTAPLLLELVLRDLKETDNIKFGDRGIHKKLTVEQLKKLGEMDSSLYKNIDFVQVMAGKLRPISDVKWQNNEAYCKAYLDKLRAFAKGPLKHATFKALILYNYLKFYEGVAQPDGNADIAAYQAAVYGNDALNKKKKSDVKPKFPTYDKDTLAAYLSLARRNAPFSATKAGKKAFASDALSVDTSFASDAFPELEAIGNDTVFVERALGYFFLKGDLTAAWPMVNKDWALVVFAKQKLMASAGNEKFLKAQQGKITDVLGARGFKSFANGSRLRLFETNRKFYKVKDAVTIEYFTKNNPEIIFNIYALNCKNYYLDNLSEIPNDIKLDGAVPIKSITKRYSKDKSIMRRADSITIKSLAGKRGVFIVDLIGRNISTRCVIRKGELRFVYEQTNGGYDVYVFDENYTQIMHPRIVMDGVTYTVNKADAEEQKEKPGKIVLPYSDDTDKEQLIIIEDSKTGTGSAVLRSFKRQAKSYTLRGGFYIDRENLLGKEQAKVLVRSNLYLCNEQTSVSLCSESFVTLEFNTLDGVTKRDVRKVSLKDDVDTEIVFTVPTNLKEIQCKLETSTGSTPLTITSSFKVNGIDSCPYIADVYLLPSPKKGYYLWSVGKNGEVFPNETFDIQLYHKFFKPNRSVNVTVTTDKNGLFELGSLPDIRSICVKPQNILFFREKEFNLLQDLVNVPSRICRKEGTIVRIPFSSATSSPSISIYDGQYSCDISKNAKYANGYVLIEGLQPGDYVVYINDILSSVTNVHISSGKSFECHLGDYVLSNSRILQLSEDTPLQIVNVDAGDDAKQMEITLQGHNDMTRCHVIITSLLPCFTPYQSLCAPIRYPDVIDFVSNNKSSYSEQSKCDAEFMYILNRNKSKKLEKVNGNMLYTPSLLFGKYAAPQLVKELQHEPIPKAVEKTQAIFKLRYDNVLEDSFGVDVGYKCEDTSNVEFLSQCSLVFSNLKPDKATGVVQVPAFKQSQFRCVQIIATDDDNTALLNYTLSGGAPIGNDMSTADIRLSPGFDDKKHYSPQRKIVCLNKGESYAIEDITSSEYIALEKLSALFDLYSGLMQGDQVKQSEFERFRPLTEWNKLSEDEKLSFYDELQCNEVNYFLYKHDRQFFENTIKPCISNKFYKSFTDLFLLDHSDLQRYADPYLFSTLNCFEQIMLCSKLSKDKGDALAKATLRSVEEAAALIQRNPRNDDRVFAASQYRNSRDLVKNVLPPQGVVILKEEKKDSSEEEEEEYNPFNFDETLQMEERTYHNVAGDVSTTDLIVANKFWKDFALYLLEDGGKGLFLSPFVGVCGATNNVNEALLGLATIDLALDGSSPQLSRARNAGVSSKKASLSPADGAAIVFIEEMVESALVSSTLSVHSNYFDPLDSSQTLHGEKVDKFVVGTFETRKIYGCRSVITNVSSVEQEVEVLLQIPSGSIAVNQSYFTKSSRVSLSPFQTERLAYYFYFPAPGDFKCYPVHINKNGRTVAFSLDERLIGMKVVSSGDEVILNRLNKEQKNSWQFIVGKQGSGKDILNFLATNPQCYEVDLAKLCSRLYGDAKFFDEATAVLKTRGIYDESVWKYALVSDKGGAELAEYLSQQKTFLEYIHPYFDSTHFKYDPFDRADWSATEFYPLQSARCHCDGVIQALSPAFVDEYGKFLLLVAFRSFSNESMSCVDKLIFVQFLLYQERIAEAQKLFASIDAEEAKAVSTLFYEYLECFLQIYNGPTGQTLQSILMKCMSWKAKPLPGNLLSLWQDLETIAKEVEKPELVQAQFDEEFIREQQEKTSKAIAFTINNKKKITLDIEFRNVTQCAINYYRVDLELLFSQSPFQSEANIINLISTIKPNEIQKVNLPKDKTSHSIDLPQQYKGCNVIIQITADETSAVQSLNDNSFDIQFDRITGSGQVRIVANKKGKEAKKPISAAYVKVYQKSGDEVQFYKDGYTDIRGRFVYKNLNKPSTEKQQLSMFVQTPDNGSTVIPITI